MHESNRNHIKDVTHILSRLKEIATSVMYAAEADTLPEVLARIAQVSAELVQAKYAALGIPDGMDGLKYFEYFGITKEEARKIGHTPKGRGLLGVIMRERHSLRLANMSDDPRAVGFPPHHPPMTSLLGVPIHVGNRLYGMLYLCDRVDGKPFDEQDQWLIETIAGYAALAITGSQLREQESRLAMLEERERIGMDLHDGVIQSLYAIGMHLEIIRTDEKPPPQDELHVVITSINEVIEDIRRYILNLKVRSYQHKTVRECLYEILNRLHLPGNMEVHVDAPDTPMPFSPATYEALCQMANEAISNVIRHANASRLQLSAQQQDGDFAIIIADNGQGFDPTTIPHQNGLGLTNIQQRARLHGGQVVIQAAPNQGTSIIISLPVQT